MDILRRKLLKPAAFFAVSSFAVSSFSALCSIRPSFYLNACGWNATDVVVLAPTARAGTFRVLESIKGDLLPEASLELPGLTPARSGTAKLSELIIRGGLDHPFQDLPPVGEGDRLIVFLRRPGALPEYSPSHQLPNYTSAWEPADPMGDLRTSTVWIQDGVTYGFLQTINPGPTHLMSLLMTEAELRRSIQTVLLQREAMDQAVATADPIERSRRLAAVVRSTNEIATMSAIEKLKRGGAPEANILVELLSDQNLLAWHQDFVGALVSMRVAGVRFAQFLDEETNYWSKVCPTLNPGWWNGAPYPNVETPRSHYTRAHALLRAIHELRLTEAAPAVRDFAEVWSTCPPLDEREQTDQIALAIESFFGH